MDEAAEETEAEVSEEKEGVEETGAAEGEKVEVAEEEKVAAVCFSTIFCVQVPVLCQPS